MPDTARWCGVKGGGSVIATDRHGCGEEYSPDGHGLVSSSLGVSTALTHAGEGRPLDV